MPGHRKVELLAAGSHASSLLMYGDDRLIQREVRARDEREVDVATSVERP
jgi:hypothetical protein